MDEEEASSRCWRHKLLHWSTVMGLPVAATTGNWALLWYIFIALLSFLKISLNSQVIHRPKAFYSTSHMHCIYIYIYGMW